MLPPEAKMKVRYLREKTQLSHTALCINGGKPLMGHRSMGLTVFAFYMICAFLFSQKESDNRAIIKIH